MQTFGELGERNSSILSLTVSPNEDRILTGSGRGTVELWDVDDFLSLEPVEQVHEFCQRLSKMGVSAFIQYDYARWPVLIDQELDPCSEFSSLDAEDGP